ncbi:hypothetical protein EN851_27130 [Mesorhizobium sp. M8A.F.Ca.ET.208.01.1.1]|uniref:hypothetical protein n=1 Tax=unclassified Mesorhizobium TaxID=325217 RepID=UPI0010937BA2|nr:MULTISPECIES: hypothetical protein [unclassified Mesorhizobium]TGQ87696.1 hypothetical protein EN851_27130 [Mesorhizobium sp. M8A.F.Ca.ET.208.01.1.1]TGT49426.1 hypothetical protein EN810_27030 [Mesorhizobium sp. M8A.F.Ca.ET.167.01.1.1]
MSKDLLAAASRGMRADAHASSHGSIVADTVPIARTPGNTIADMAPEPSLNAAIGMRQIGTPADVADLLPPPARAKLVALREQLDDLRQAVWAQAEAWEEARKNKSDAKLRVLILTDHNVAQRYGKGHRSYALDHPSVVQAEATFASASERFARITEKRDSRAFRSHELARLIDAVEGYIARAVHSHSRLELFTGGGKFERKPAASIDASRKAIATLRADRQEVRTAPLPSSKVKERIRAEVEELAEKGRPNVFNAIEYGEAIGWPALTMPVSTAGLLVTSDDAAARRLIGAANAAGPDALSLLAWLHRDALLAALDKEVDSLADDSVALDDDTRAKKLAQIAAALLDEERTEVMMVEKTRGDVAFRPDTDPRALLGIVGPDPE